ncbi:MAG TPA: hypothetical protein DDW93_04680 [Firmicutes bacterium]|nr:hypothetical protein [Bacillota bacterium]HBK69408.1 hypothetical protein [Bacillota bacterium]HBT16599.1 hypothetical protein [Bacillota bacterium]
MQKNRISDWKTIVNYLKEEGRIRLLEAGKDIRIYQYISFSGDKVKICLYQDGTLDYTEVSK